MGHVSVENLFPPEGGAGRGANFETLPQGESEDKRARGFIMGTNHTYVKQSGLASENFGNLFRVLLVLIDWEHTMRNMVRTSCSMVTNQRQ